MNVEEPSDAEHLWLEARVEEVRLLLLRRGVDLSALALDGVVDRAPRPMPEAIGLAVGAGLGAVISERLGFSWRAADDGFQVRLVLEGPEGALIDPFELVWRRAGGGPRLDDVWRSLREAAVDGWEG